MGKILEFRAVRERAAAVALSATGGAAGALRWAASEAVGAAPRIAEVAVVPGRRAIGRTVAGARAAGGAGAAAASRAVYGFAEAAPRVGDAAVKRLQSMSAAGDRALRASMLAPREWVARNVAGEAHAPPDAAPRFSTQRLAKIGVIAVISALALLGLVRVLSWMPFFAKTPARAPAEQAATLPPEAIGSRSNLPGTESAADAAAVQPAPSTPVRVEHVVAPGKRSITDSSTAKLTTSAGDKGQGAAKKSGGDRAESNKPAAEKSTSKDTSKQTASRQKENKQSGARKSKQAASEEKPAASSSTAATQTDVTSPW
jgi:hypothetical protein